MIPPDRRRSLRVLVIAGTAAAIALYMLAAAVTGARIVEGIK